MARSVHAFVRGSAREFYEWIEQSPVDLPELPPVWICGDCHLGNLGPIADAEGRVAIQIRDLDQTVIGNPAHDLVRLGLSLETAARSSTLPGIATSAMIDALARGYAEGVALDEPPSEPDAVRTVRKRALGRRWSHLIGERTDGREWRLPRNGRFWSLAKKERAAVDEMLARTDVATAALALAPPGAHRLRVADAAYWRKGCSSLGTVRIALLLALEGADGAALHALADVKEATRPVAPASSRLTDGPADRVVAGAKALAPNLGERMIASTFLNTPVVIRELKPQDLKLEVEQFSTKQAGRAAAYLGHVVGSAHGKQLNATQRRALTKAIEDAGAGRAPDWLWESVVELAGRSEAAYLAHCRRLGEQCSR